MSSTVYLSFSLSFAANVAPALPAPTVLHYNCVEIMLFLAPTNDEIILGMELRRHSLLAHVMRPPNTYAYCARDDENRQFPQHAFVKERCL